MCDIKPKQRCTNTNIRQKLLCELQMEKVEAVLTMDLTFFSCQKKTRTTMSKSKLIKKICLSRKKDYRVYFSAEP